MARFASEAELNTFLGRLDADYSQFASALWQNGVRTAHRLANARESILRSCGLPELYIDDIKARADSTAPQASGRLPARQQQSIAADETGEYVRRLLEPALETVPAAVDIPTLCNSALHISGTPPFPVPDVFYESQRLQNKDMEFYLAPVSQSGAVTLSSAIHTVLCKQFPVGAEMVQAAQFDQLVCEIMELLDSYAGRLNLKRKQNEGEASLTLKAKRPDLCLLIRNALLFKGEDKHQEARLDQAVAELKQKMRCWSHSYHGQVEFLLCYAMAGGHVRICMLHCDAPDSCIVLSGDHNIYAIRGRLELLRIAVLLYRILTIQQTQLPSDAVPLGSELEFSSGTTITVTEDYIIKRVDIQKQPHLIDQLSEL